MYYKVDTTNKEIVIFGTGEIAHRFCTSIIAPERVSFFVDNDKSKQNQTCFGKPIFSPNILLNKDLQGRVCILIASVASYKDISNQLIRLGFQETIDFFDTSHITNDTSILEVLEGPLFTISPLGKKVKEIMLSSEGERIRDNLVQFRPWCGWFPSMIVVLSDGSVTTCCVDSYGKQVFGNVYEKDIKQVLSDKLPDILQRGLYDFEICRNCVGEHPFVSLISNPKEYEVWLHSYQQSPATLQLEIMGACNYQCPCPAGEIYKLRPVKLNLEKTFCHIKSILPELNQLNLFNFGEPLLNDGFVDFIKKCRDAAPDLFIVLATNGLLMNEHISQALIEAKVNQVIVSVHGGPGTENMLKYSKVNANYDVVIKQVKQLIKLREDYQSSIPKVALKAVLFNWNDTDETMNQLRRDAGELGLRPLNGDPQEDTYYWVIDQTRNLSSKRFTNGSEALKRLIEQGEFRGALWF